MTDWQDVSDKISSATVDDEACTIGNCPVCGVTFPFWEFIISIYKDTPKACPNCGSEFYFQNEVRVYVRSKA